MKELEESSKNQNKKPGKWWILIMVGLVLICLCIDYFLFNFIINVDDVPALNQSIKEELCRKVTSVPTWIVDGEIDDVGYKVFQNDFIDEIVDRLIENEIYFMYSSNCGYCHKQIEDFGDEWQRYVDSGLTIDCLEVW